MLHENVGSSCPDYSGATYTQQILFLAPNIILNLFFPSLLHDVMSMQSLSTIPAPKGQHPLASYYKLMNRRPSLVVDILHSSQRPSPNQVSQAPCGLEHLAIANPHSSNSRGHAIPVYGGVGGGCLHHGRRHHYYL